MELGSELDGDAEVQELLKSFVAIKVDLTDRSESNPSRAVFTKYGGRQIPDVRILSSDGQEVARPQTTKAAIVAALKKALGR